MSTPTLLNPPRRQRGRSLRGALQILALGLFVTPVASGCAGEEPAAAWTHQPITVTTPGPADSNATAQAAAWAGRPDFARSNARVEAAYAYAMEAPEVLRWMPCYCGCGAMGHGSNLDCFYKPATDGRSSLTFEEHGSYCGICVDTALLVKQLRADGQSLRAIRDAVDATFGSAAPGTPTELPPA